MQPRYRTGPGDSTGEDSSSTTDDPSGTETADTSTTDPTLTDSAGMDFPLGGMCLAMCAGTPNSPICDDPARCHDLDLGTLHMCRAHMCRARCDPIQDFCISGDGCCGDTQNNLFTCDETGNLPNLGICVVSG